MASNTGETIVIEFTEQNTKQTGLTGVKKKEADILLLQKEAKVY